MVAEDVLRPLGHVFCRYYGNCRYHRLLPVFSTSTELPQSFSALPVFHRANIISNIRQSSDMCASPSTPSGLSNIIGSQPGRQRSTHMRRSSAERLEPRIELFESQEPARSELIPRTSKDIDIGFNSPFTGRNCRLYNNHQLQHLFNILFHQRFANQQSIRSASTASLLDSAWSSRYQLTASSIPFRTFPSRLALPHIFRFG
jgi:hypothetical protein